MKQKDELLSELATLVEKGYVSQDEVKSVFKKDPAALELEKTKSEPDTPAPKSDLSHKFTGAMFVASSIIMFAALHFAIMLANGGPALFLIINILVVTLGWVAAHAAVKTVSQSSISQGVSLMMFTLGSLSLLAVPFFALLVIHDSLPIHNMATFSLLLSIGYLIMILGAIGYYIVTKNRLALSVGAFSLWLSIGSMTLAILNADPYIDPLPGRIATIALGLMLPISAGIIDIRTRFGLERGFFAFFGVLMSLVSLFWFTMDKDAAIWYFLTAIAILASFGWAIYVKMRSLFMLASIATIFFSISFCFRYITGDAVALGLFASSILVLACAIGLTALHKKYFSGA